MRLRKVLTVGDFIPGLELSRIFFFEAVEPIIGTEFPKLRYAAGLLGSGSEVLGFDTERSMDHDWGPRVDIFLKEADLERVGGELDDALRRRLPRRFRGFPTSFTAPDPDDNGTRLPELGESELINHKIGIATTRQFFQRYLAFDIVAPVEPADWLTFPEQKLRSIAEGAIFRDQVGLGDTRQRFAYYPHDVWRYLLAASWTRIGQEEHLMGRAGESGDEIGSALIGARLVRDVMRLCFLMEKTYAPYPKWFGVAFQRLACAHDLSPHLRTTLGAVTWREREAALVSTYEIVASLHNSLGITDPMPTKPRDFFGRPFQVMALHGFAKAIVSRISDERMLRLARRPLIGGLDQFSDSTDLAHAEWRGVLRALYD